MEIYFLLIVYLLIKSNGLRTKKTNGEEDKDWNLIIEDINERIKMNVSWSRYTSFINYYKIYRLVYNIALVS